MAERVRQAREAGGSRRVPPLERREHGGGVAAVVCAAADVVSGATGAGERGLQHAVCGAAEGRAEGGALERALNEMVRRHEVLRTRFVVRRESGAGRSRGR